MSDIVERLRAWVYTDSLYATAREAADEIERMRQVSSQENMTDAERDVLREVCRVYADEDDVRCNEIAFVIDRLLARLVPAANSTPDNRTGCGESRTGSVDAKVVEDVAKCTVKSKKLPERDRRVRSLEARLEELRAASDKADAEYRAEIARLREAIRRLADQDATMSVQGGNVTVTMDATLTDAEREAVEYFSGWCLGPSKRLTRYAATLRGLLERMGGKR